MIYFAQRNDGLVKIGYTTQNAAVRLKALQAMHDDLVFLGSIPDGRSDQEKALHTRFESSRIIAK